MPPACPGLSETLVGQIANCAFPHQHPGQQLARVKLLPLAMKCHFLSCVGTKRVNLCLLTAVIILSWGLEKQPG